ncbi:MAG: AEC family transporter [Oscillospiraceae bacterium]|jgi:malate permease and related proteins
MFSIFLNVLTKIAILFLMIAVGYACGKYNIISDGGAKEMTAVLFWIVTPCLIISSVQDVTGKVSIENLILSGVLSAVCIAVAIGFSYLLFRKHSAQRKNILRFAVSYSNCGFMGLPLASALLGPEGVAYASIFIAVFNLFVWTHGVSCMKQKAEFSYRKALLNPGTVGLAVALGLSIFSYRLPEIFLSPMQFFSGLNTPLAMLVIGVYISEVPLNELFSDSVLYWLALARLLVIPMLCFFLLLPFHVDQIVFTTLLILISAPTAANSVMFAAQFGCDTRLGSKAVALTTLLSAFTMPLFPTLVNYFS